MTRLLLALAILSVHSAVLIVPHLCTRAVAQSGATDTSDDISKIKSWEYLDDEGRKGVFFTDGRLGKWYDFKEEKLYATFREVRRTRNYVEIYDKTRDLTLRVHSRHAIWRTEKNGRWYRLPFPLKPQNQKEAAYNGKTVSEWVEILKSSKSKKDRFDAAVALGEIGPEAKAAVPALVEALKDKGHLIDIKAAQALGKIGPAAKAAVPALIDTFKDKKRLFLHIFAARALSEIGPDAKAAVPVLKAVSKNHWDSGVRRYAAMALKKLVDSLPEE